MRDDLLWICQIIGPMARASIEETVMNDSKVQNPQRGVIAMTASWLPVVGHSLLRRRARLEVRKS